MNLDIYNNIVKVMSKVTEMEFSDLNEEMELDSPEIGMSSVDIVTILIELEEMYNIQFPDNSLKIKVIRNIANIIEEQLIIKDERNEKISETIDNLF